MREFNTGATRDSDEDKLDYDGFLSPLVLRRYAEYMHKHRRQADEKMRASDNWKRGIPIDQYMKSKWRHFMETWILHHTPGKKASPEVEESLCAELFNTMGMLYQLLRSK